MKKFTLFILAAVLILGTAACSSKQDKEENSGRKNNFQSEAFADALQFAATLPEYAERFELEEKSYDSRYIEDKALLQPVTIRYIPDLVQQIYDCIGEDIAYVGYPAESRKGSCIRVFGMSFALSAGSHKLDGWWEFVRTFLTEDFQRDGLYRVNRQLRRKDIVL